MDDRLGTPRQSRGVQREGPLVLDRASRGVELDGRRLSLTQAEYALLAALADQAGRAVASEVLLEAMWGVSWGLETTSLQVHVSRLRRKLGESGQDPRLVHTVRGFGYRLQWIPAQGPTTWVDLRYDRDFVLRLVDPPANLLGWRPDEIVGTDYSPVGVTVEVLRALVTGLLALGRPEVTGEMHLRHRDGSVVVTDGITRLVMDADGDFDGLHARLSLPRT